MCINKTAMLINQSHSKLKVVIMDDHFLFSLNLQKILKKYDFLDAVTVLTPGDEAFARLDELNPDLICIDLNISSAKAFAFMLEISTKYPATKIIAVTGFDEGENVKNAIEAGAWAFINRNSEQGEYDELFTRIRQDKMYISPAAAINYAFLMAEIAREENKSKPVITKREIEIIGFVAKGYADKEIAKELQISSRTIDAHKQKMMHKLGTRKAAEIVAIAYKMNLI
jgi:two-component system response regulator NreC